MPMLGTTSSRDGICAVRTNERGPPPSVTSKVASERSAVGTSLNARLDFLQKKMLNWPAEKLIYELTGIKPPIHYLLTESSLSSLGYMNYILIDNSPISLQVLINQTGTLFSVMASLVIPLVSCCARYSRYSRMTRFGTILQLRHSSRR
jgi:hypothetical protein